MCTYDSFPHSKRCPTVFRAAILRITFAVATTILIGRQLHAQIIDPLADGSASPNLFDEAPAAAPVQNPFRTAKTPQYSRQRAVRPTFYQTDNRTPFADDATRSALPALPEQKAAAKDPCAAVAAKPLDQLGIGIDPPAGRLPTDLATACWDKVNQGEGASAALRCWPLMCYNWDATCFCHNPLYFEEANLERYGYQCGDRCACCCSCGRECCLQPAASAFHFFGTIPTLPYCMLVDCPTDCIYTLGHYRPGDCNPWRWYWPDFDPLAGALYGGFWIGMVAAFP
jgi:hypothetical protein